jgi:thioesterase domain-containing protein
MRRIRSRYWEWTFNWEQPEEPTVTDVLRIVRESNYLAARKYKAQPYDGTATLFLAANRGIEGFSDPVEQWNSLVRGGVRAITVPGDHVTMGAEPHVRVLAQRLDECLAEANLRFRPRMPQQSHDAA